MLKPNDKVGIISCSNGWALSMKDKMDVLVDILRNEFQLVPVMADTIFVERETGYSYSPEKRGAALMSLYKDPSVKMIFDVSGGELANEILPYLDFDLIKKSGIPYVGYSDLTVLLNAIYVRTGLSGFNYHLPDLLNGERQKIDFQNEFLSNNSMASFKYEFLTDSLVVNDQILNTQVIVIGGNIRCFLKLAGTRYMPQTQGVLLLESCCGSVELMASLFAQLEQTGVLGSCQGILMGQFSSIDEENRRSELDEIALHYAARYSKPVLKTAMIGHSGDSVPIPIGRKIMLPRM